MKLMYFTDPHFASQGPISRKDDYMATVFNKLDEIKGLIKKESCEALLVSGDWFHLKAANKTTYALVNSLTDYFKSLDVPIVGIFGDHDVPDRLEASVAHQPLGALVRAVGIKMLDKSWFYPIGDGVVISGASKTADYESDITNYVPQAPKEGTKLLIHMCHGDLYPNRPVYEPWTSYEALKDSPAGITLRGHIHRNDGVVQVGKTKIVGIGSLTRGTFNTDSINRRPSVAVITTETKEVKVIELKSAPKSEDIFDLEKREKEDRAEDAITALGQLIRSESEGIELNGPESIRHAVRVARIDEKVKSTALDLLDRAEAVV